MPAATAAEAARCAAPSLAGGGRGLSRARRAIAIPCVALLATVLLTSTAFAEDEGAWTGSSNKPAANPVASSTPKANKKLRWKSPNRNKTASAPARPVAPAAEPATTESEVVPVSFEEPVKKKPVKAGTRIIRVQQIEELPSDAPEMPSLTADDLQLNQAPPAELPTEETPPAELPPAVEPPTTDPTMPTVPPMPTAPGGYEPNDTPQSEEEYQEFQAQAPSTEYAPCPSPRDMKPITQITNSIEAEGGKFPPECTLGDEEFVPRCWTMTTYTWKASGLCHKPLYFEDVNLERYGHTLSPWLQPVISGAHFFATIPILPYKMGIETPCECVYPLGYYRPGSCSPHLLYPFPLSLRGALVEGGVATGLVFLIP